MRKQKEMVEAFQIGHRDFMRNLHTSLDILDRDISEAKEVDTICTGEWCKAVEISIDELANYVYSLSEPRWASRKDSQNIRRMRNRIHDLYLRYRSVGGTSVH